jgi:hypothetical protein
MIVVDLGTWAHHNPGYDSVTALVDRFHPELLWGFDPLLETEGACFLGDTLVVVRRMAAWTRDGETRFTHDGTGSKIGKGRRVPCFNLCAWLETLPQPIVLKMDVEGAEITLTRKLRETGMDERLALLLVELHGGQLPDLHCPVEEWWL